MTRRITLEAASAAYERQGLNPRAGVTLDLEKRCACPIAALALDAGAKEEPSQWADREYGPDYVIGFMCGFDGWCRSSLDDGEEEGFDDGEALALALQPPGRLCL